MRRSIPFFLIGILALFIAIFAPIFTLLAWISSGSVALFLTIAAAVSVPAFFLFWHTLNNSQNMKLRWVWMQVLGLGTVLLPLVLVGTILTFLIDSRSVGLLVLLIWPVLSAIGLWQGSSVKPRFHKFRAKPLTSPLRMVQLSDVHVGSRSAAFLNKVVKQAIAHKPDIVVITGDLLDASAVNAETLCALKLFECPVYMCIGNHERYVDLEKAIAAIESQGVIVLRDSAVNVGELQIIGIDDRDRPTELPALLGAIGNDETHYSVLLYHRPDGWQAALQNDIDLMLAGHTHAGQMWPFGLFVKRQYPQMAGLFSKADKHLYVSIGTGTWGPVFRLGTRCEMTVIDLE